MSETIRWGVMGTARIAEKVGAAIRAVEGAELAAVASRVAERAATWAEAHGATRSYGSYQELLDDDELDAIYIPLPPSMHHAWALRTAESGKHLLCEKPVATNAAQVEEMVAAFAQANRQLMDGVMWVHTPRAADMLNHINSGALGSLRRVTSAFSFFMESWLENNVVATGGAATLADAMAREIRLQREFACGALGDLGWYNVRATLWAFGGLPERVYATARYRNDVEINTSATLWYDHDRMASFDCGFDQTWRKWFEVIGTEGSLVCDDFVNAWDQQRPRYWVHDGAARPTEHISEPRIQEQCMVRRFCEIARTAQLDDQWPKIALANRRVIDAIDQSARTGKIVELS